MTGAKLLPFDTALPLGYAPIPMISHILTFLAVPSTLSARADVRIFGVASGYARNGNVFNIGARIVDGIL